MLQINVYAMAWIGAIGSTLLLATALGASSPVAVCMAALVALVAAEAG